MSELAFGKNVELRPHAVDRYGRTVAQVFVDGRDAGLGAAQERAAPGSMSVIRQGSANRASGVIFGGSRGGAIESARPLARSI